MITMDSKLLWSFGQWQLSDLGMLSTFTVIKTPQPHALGFLNSLPYSGYFEKFLFLDISKKPFSLKIISYWLWK